MGLPGGHLCNLLGNRHAVGKAEVDCSAGGHGSSAAEEEAGLALPHPGIGEDGDALSVGSVDRGESQRDKALVAFDDATHGAGAAFRDDEAVDDEGFGERGLEGITGCSAGAGNRFVKTHRDRHAR